jgi:DNA replication protein DnaC
LDLFKKFRKQHLKTLHSKVENIKVLGMSTPINLANIYSPSYVSPTIHNRLFDRKKDSVEEITAKFSEKIEKENAECRADEFIESKDNVVVLGGAGSGKTTLLRYLALAYSKKEVFANTKLKTPKIPFYVRMYEYSQNDKALFDYIADPLISATSKYAEDYLTRIFQKGKAIIFLDALDEVPIKIRERYISYIENFSDSYPQCKIVITCRTADFTATLENFFEVELVKLKQPAVAKIIRAWFEDEPSTATKLLKLLRREKDVRSLTETPLLLSLLCIQFRHDLTLPKRKTELYERCINAFLRDWDTSRGFRRDTSYSILSDETKHSIFQEVAGRYSSDQIQLTFPEKELQELVGSYCERFGCNANEGKNILNEIERHHGIIERFSQDHYTFSHSSFQEYYAARFFLNKRSEFEVAKKNFDDEQWANLIEFIVSMHSEPDDILLFLKGQSTMVRLKTYPAMALRTKRLWFLYRCLSVAHYLTNQDRFFLYKHLVDTQIQMARIYGEGGVYPVAVLMPDGVHHAYFYTKKRPTLRDALQPYRMFSNEILFNPSEIYAAIVITELEKQGFMTKNHKSIQENSLALSLAIPISSIRPDKVKIMLNLIIEGSDKNMAELANESKKMLEDNIFYF